VKILLVSWFFPPTNTMGALRVGNLASYFMAQGHDVRVVSAHGVPRPQDLKMDFPEDRVARTKWFDINGVPKAAAALRNRFRARPATAGPPVKSSGGEASPYLRRRWSLRNFPSCLASLYVDLFNLPDATVGWTPYAVGAAKALFGPQGPDLIYASGPPFSAFLIARLLARKYRAPWVAELRDRWSDDPYYPPVPWRRWIVAALERRLLTSAAALVTVSEPWAETYRRRYSQPVMAIYNGYNAADYSTAAPGAPDAGHVSIVYTGRIYPGRRDPSPLFEAMALTRHKDAVRVSFYGTVRSSVMPLAERHGVADLVQVHSHVPHREAMEIQARADVLLLMQWDDPREQGNVPGKLFEYLAARRPILGLGLEDGVPASIIRQREAGFFSNDPHAIAGQLSIWAARKRECGGLAPLPESVRTGFSRAEQFAKLVDLLNRVRDTRRHGA